jgi:hypothetical protein
MHIFVSLISSHTNQQHLFNFLYDGKSGTFFRKTKIQTVVDLDYFIDLKWLFSFLAFMFKSLAENNLGINP